MFVPFHSVYSSPRRFKYQIASITSQFPPGVSGVCTEPKKHLQFPPFATPYNGGLLFQAVYVIIAVSLGIPHWVFSFSCSPNLQSGMSPRAENATASWRVFCWDGWGWPNSKNPSSILLLSAGIFFSLNFKMWQILKNICKDDFFPP